MLYEGVIKRISNMLCYLVPFQFKVTDVKIHYPSNSICYSQIPSSSVFLVRKAFKNDYSFFSSSTVKTKPTNISDVLYLPLPSEHVCVCQSSSMLNIGLPVTIECFFMKKGKSVPFLEFSSKLKFVIW